MSKFSVEAYIKDEVTSMLDRIKYKSSQEVVLQFELYEIFELHYLIDTN